MWERVFDNGGRRPDTRVRPADGSRSSSALGLVDMPASTGPSVDQDADRRLVEAVALEGAFDRTMALGLSRIWDDQSYRALGYARGTDYARERLGMKAGRACRLVKLGRALGAVPELHAALAIGHLNTSQAIELTPVLKQCNSATERLAWIERASHLTVRALRSLVASTLAAEGSGAGSEGPSDSDNGGGGDANDVHLSSPYEADEGDFLTFAAPARVAELWVATASAARKLSGSHAPPHECAELISAEYLAFAGDRGAGTSQSQQPSASDRSSPTNDQEHPGDHNPDETAAGSRSDGRVDSVAPVLAEALGKQLSNILETGSATQLTALLRQLVKRKRRLRLEIGAQLAQVERTGQWRSLGFETLEAYCNARLQMSRRRAQALVQFQRRLRRLKRLRRAYLSGAISYSGIRRLLAVVRPSTEGQWAAWARGLSCRDIDAAVEHAQLYSGRAPTFASGGAENGAHRQKSAGSGAEEGRGTVPTLGCPLPPLSRRSRPRIANHQKLITDYPEVATTRIRFWAPTGAAEVIRRALACCRANQGPAHRQKPDWCFLEIILAHFLLTHDTPETRRCLRRHKILARDDFLCAVPTCTSRANLHAHHLWMRSNGGPDDAWNMLTLCASHHRMAHTGVVEIGGWAPWAIVVRMGIDARTGRAAECYANGRRSLDTVGRARVAAWRRWCRTHGRRMKERQRREAKQHRAARPERGRRKNLTAPRRGAESQSAGGQRCP